MRHAFISPINYLHLIPEWSNYHLLLAHLLTDDKYCEFYRERKKRGDFIVCDNGSFENGKPMQLDEYASLIKASGIKFDVVVAPDFPFKTWTDTYSATKEFSDNYHKYFPKSTQIMAVPQSIKGDYNGWLECYKRLSNLKNVSFIGLSVLGIPNAFCELTGTDDITYNRMFAVNLMIRNELINKRVKHHFLGCGDPREILMMKMQGIAYGNDSSTAFWHGVYGVEFDNTVSGLKNGKIKEAVDFNHYLYEPIIPCIQHNIEWIRRILEFPAPLVRN